MTLLQLLKRLPCLFGGQKFKTFFAFSHKLRQRKNFRFERIEISLYVSNYPLHNGIYGGLCISNFNEMISRSLCRWCCFRCQSYDFILFFLSTPNEVSSFSAFSYIIMRLIWFVHKKLGLLSWEYRDVFYMHQLQKWIKQVAIYLHYLQSTFENCWI